MRRGINLVEWTFDPLELKNAYFNFVRLGAVARRLIPNCYGITNSPLHSGLPTDRLVAEWWLDSARVQAILEGTPLAGKGAGERIPLPSNIGEIKAQDPEAAAARPNRASRPISARVCKRPSGHVDRAARRALDYILEPCDADCRPLPPGISRALKPPAAMRALLFVAPAVSFFKYPFHLSFHGDSS